MKELTVFPSLPCNNANELGVWFLLVHKPGGSVRTGKTGVTADRDKIEFRLFNSSSIFNITLREELFSIPKKNETFCLVPVMM